MIPITIISYDASNKSGRVPPKPCHVRGITGSQDLDHWGEATGPTCNGSCHCAGFPLSGSWENKFVMSFDDVTCSPRRPKRVRNRGVIASLGYRDPERYAYSVR